MQNISELIIIKGLLGQCGAKEVFLGFAPARLLHAISFADVLDDDTGIGYQRPRDRKHSANFKRYISQPEASTIPLTFNLRQDMKYAWQIHPSSSGDELRVNPQIRCLAQVDCQHRLGELGDSDVPLAFMAFIGLDLRNEMAMFTVINSKAKGLASSLTDYHTSNLVEDIASDAPHLYLARELNRDSASPWFSKIRYGGETSSGMRRTTSLRMMQTAIKHLLVLICRAPGYSICEAYNLLIAYWQAVETVFHEEWKNPRSNLLVKGVGLHAMMNLLGTIVINKGTMALDKLEFVKVLSRLRKMIDWGPNGTFANAGGRKGALQAHEVLRKSLGI